MLLSTQALALSRDVSRTKQIAKANILFSSARPAKLSVKALPARTSSGAAPSGGAIGTHTLFREKARDAGVWSTHTFLGGGFCFKSSPGKEQGGLPLLPASQLHGTGCETKYQFSSALPDWTPPSSLGQPGGLSHQVTGDPGAREPVYKSRARRKTMLAHLVRSPAHMATTTLSSITGGRQL